MANVSGASENRIQIMGIINSTPDSFHEASRSGDVERAMRMVDEGADWIDIGGESTRPGAKKISIEEELSRVIPIVKEVSKFCNVSIDTKNFEVAKAALESGAIMINDVSGLRDERMRNLVIEKKCYVCIMHMQGEPENMQENPDYGDVVEEVSQYLLDKANDLVENGHPSDKIYLDPGIGFGKNLEHNIELLQSSSKLRPFKILWGVSRKSLIGEICNQAKTDDRLAGTLAIAAYAHQQEIEILRVHDVREHKDMISVLEAIN